MFLSGKRFPLRGKLNIGMETFLHAKQLFTGKTHYNTPPFITPLVYLFYVIDVSWNIEEVSLLFFWGCWFMAFNSTKDCLKRSFKFSPKICRCLYFCFHMDTFTFRPSVFRFGPEPELLTRGTVQELTRSAQFILFHSQEVFPRTLS